MRWFPVSATTIFPVVELKARPCGPKKLAEMPWPSAKAALPLPASVETAPRDVAIRMQLLPVSAT